MDMGIDKLLKTVPFTRENIKVDSREVKPGDVFVAIRGHCHDGHNYIPEVLEKGALQVLSEKKILKLSEEYYKKVIFVEDTRAALGDMAKHAFGDPSDSLTIYGVTGTNGKTTTVFLIDSILNNAARPSGLVSTVFTKTSKDVLNRSIITTPDVMTLNSILSEMVQNGKREAAIEVSSHALSQKRLWGIGLDSAVFTNITSEHLDYHKDMKTYLKAKSGIFRNLKSNKAIAVLNADDPMVMGLTKAADFPQFVTFGIRSAADIMAKEIRLSAGGTEFDLTGGKFGLIRIRTGFIGQHNVYNMLAAAAALSNSGLSSDQVKNGLENAPAVPGRLDRVHTNAPFQVFIDYAHTPDAIENVLKCLRPFAKRKLICVFGCGGDRDQSKRPLMGKITARICDNVILTDDNPRTEDPEEILKQIEKGMRNKTNYSIINQRRDAIRKALETGKRGDVVIIAGKGHEDYQIIGSRKIPF